MSTASTTTLSITPEQPYDFKATAAFAARFNDRSGADYFSGGVYTRAIELRFQPLIFSLHVVGTAKVPELALELEYAGPTLDSEVVFAAQLTAARMMGVRQKIDEFYHMASEDWTLKELIEDFEGLRLPQTSSLFESLIQVVIANDLPRRQAEVIREELVEQFGQPIAGQGLTLKAFPTERALLDDVARIKQMSGPIAGLADYMAAIAEASLSGALDRETFEKMSDEETIDYLAQLPGMNEWMAARAMMLGLGRTDVLPVDDPMVRRGVALMNGQGRPAAPDQVAEFGVRWKPWRSLAATYVTAAMRHGRDYWS